MQNLEKQLFVKKIILHIIRIENKKNNIENANVCV